MNNFGIAMEKDQPWEPNCALEIDGLTLYSTVDFDCERDEFDWAMCHIRWVAVAYFFKRFTAYMANINDEYSDIPCPTNVDKCRDVLSYFGHEEIDKVLKMANTRELDDDTIEWLKDLEKFARMQIPKKKDAPTVTLMIIKSDKPLAMHEKIIPIPRQLVTT